MSLYSINHNFCFIRVPRTGSTTVFRAIRKAYEQKQGDFYDMQWEDETMPWIGGPNNKNLIRTKQIHPPAIQIKEKLKDKWKNIESFGCIRNPWRWFVSVWESKHWHDGEYENFYDFVINKKQTPVDWLIDENKNIIVKHVFKTENINEDLNNFLSSINQNIVINKKFNEGVYNNPPYEYFVQHPELIDYIANKCSREIELGNYKYDLQ